MDIVKLKRQIRDYFNKQVNDKETLLAIAKIMNFTPPAKREAV